MKLKTKLTIVVLALASTLFSSCSNEEEDVSLISIVPEDCAALIYMAGDENMGMPFEKQPGINSAFKAITSNALIKEKLAAFAKDLSEETNGLSAYFLPQNDPLWLAAKYMKLKNFEIVAFISGEITADSNSVPEITIAAQIPDESILDAFKKALKGRATEINVSGKAVYKIAGKPRDDKSNEQAAYAAIDAPYIYAATTKEALNRVTASLESKPKTCIKDSKLFKKVCKINDNIYVVLFVDPSKIKTKGADGKLHAQMQGALEAVGAYSQTKSLTACASEIKVAFAPGFLKKQGIKFPPLKYCAADKFSAIENPIFYAAISYPEISGTNGEMLKAMPITQMVDSLLSGSEIEISMSQMQLDKIEALATINVDDAQKAMQRPEFAQLMLMANSAGDGKNAVKKLTDNSIAFAFSSTNGADRIIEKAASRKNNAKMLAKIKAPEDAFAKFYIDSLAINKAQIKSAEELGLDNIDPDARITYEISKITVSCLKKNVGYGYAAFDGDTLSIYFDAEIEYDYENLAENIKKIK